MLMIEADARAAARHTKTVRPTALTRSRCIGGPVTGWGVLSDGRPGVGWAKT
jgi:hypothetical protein